MLGEKLRRLRHDAGLTIENVADDIGYSKSMVDYWELGRSYPTPEAIYILEEYWGVQLDRRLTTEVRTESIAMRRLREWGRDAGKMRRALSLLGLSPEAVAGLEVR